jgi:hypothetical protein
LKPRSLSATAIQDFEDCPAGYAAKYIGDRPPRDSGEAANFGTGCHSVLERWVVGELYKTDPQTPFSVMEGFWHEEYDKLFSHDGRRQEGVDLLKKWYVRQDWEGRTVLAAEQKLSFPVKSTSGLEVPFNYIFDRCDRLDNGNIEVVDYKTYMAPMQPGDLKHRIQARMYGLAAAILYPDAPRIWITFDLLRWEPISISYTRDELLETWSYLKRTLDRILASDGKEEKLGPNCRYCVRNHVCRSVRMVENMGGVLSLPPEQMADRLSELEYVKKAAETAADEIRTHLLKVMEEEGLMELEGESNRITVTASSRRNVDPLTVSEIVGPEIMSRYGKLNLGDIDDLLKGDELSLDQKNELRASIRQGFGNPTLKVKPITKLEKES